MQQFRVDGNIVLSHCKVTSGYGFSADYHFKPETLRWLYCFCRVEVRLSNFRSRFVFSVSPRFLREYHNICSMAKLNAQLSQNRACAIHAHGSSLGVSHITCAIFASFVSNYLPPLSVVIVSFAKVSSRDCLFSAAVTLLHRYYSAIRLPAPLLPSLLGYRL